MKTITTLTLAFFSGLMLFTVTGCTNAARSSLNSYGCDHTITVYSGNTAVKVFHSRGAVRSVSHSDGYYFQDKATGKFVSVSGTVVIEQE